MKIKIFNVSLLIGLFIVIGTLSGCGQSDDDLSRYIRKVKKRPGRTIEPLPTFKPLDKFKYPEQKDRRSPFIEHTAIDKSGADAPDTNRRRQPLEAYALDALKFVGTLKRNRTTWALIKEPNGKVSRIKAGGYMGKNFGRVLVISNDAIKLQETIKVAGKWERRITKLSLHKNSSGS